jgi:hypothetical protein
MLGCAAIGELALAQFPSVILAPQGDVDGITRRDSIRLAKALIKRAREAHQGGRPRRAP